MASLWTPDGEHAVPRDAPVSGAPDPSSAPEPGRVPAADPAEYDPSEHGSLGADPFDPGDAEVAAEMAELERQLVSAPVEDVVANHCYGLFQLAALHLAQRPPDLAQARVAIDALAAVVDTLGKRLGGQSGTLADGLAQIRLAFVQLSNAPVAPSDGTADTSTS